MSAVTEARRAAQRKLGTKMIGFGAGGLMVPDPIPLVDEIIFSAIIVAGGALYIHGSLPYGSVSSYPSQSHPITSTTGHLSERNTAKKQIRSTSHSYSRRRRYYYGKKRKYYT